MTGNLDPPDQKGIIPRGCEEMFNRITSGSDENVSFEVKASFLEMYNEKLQDLLDPKTTKTISIRESPTKGIYVENVVEQLVKSYKEIDKLITDGNKVRTVAATAMNATSSRSHSVLTIFFTRNEIISGKKTQKDSRVNLVDLAGSERQSQTESTGDRLAEACAINKSLSALGNVIAALVDQAKGKNTFVPYRDSLLTRMLQDSLGGNSKTIMIAAASPASSNYSETLSTLQFADRAKQIKNKPVVNESETDKLIRQLREEIEELKSQLIGDGSSGSSSQNNPESNPGIGGISPEEEEEFQKRQNEAEAELEKKRNELEQQYAAAAKEEQRLEAAREEYEKQMEELKSQGGTDVPGNQKLIEELAAKKAQLDAQQKALQDQIAKNNAAAEALAKKQLEIDQLRSQHEQEQDELIIAQKKLQDLQLTSSQKEKIAAEAKARREAYLSDLGLSITELGDAARADKDGPRLSNLSLSPDLCGALVYFLRPGEIFVGSAPQTGGATQFIVLQSLGVENIHCKITYDKNAKEVAIIPQGEKGRVLINDIWVEAERQVLVPGDRIIIGNNVVLRFIYDAIQRVNPNIDMEQQIELIQAELAVAHGKVNTVEEYIQKTRTMSWLLHADEIVDEANSIAQALGRRIFFGMDIHPEEKNVMVRVNSLEQGVVQEWDLNVLEKRLPMMRQMLHNQINSKNGSKLIPPLQNTYYGINYSSTPSIENDLFFNPPTDITIGKAKFPLNSLAQTGWIEASFGIREEGEPLIIVGKLRIKARLMNIVNVLGSSTQQSSIQAQPSNTDTGGASGATIIQSTSNSAKIQSQSQNNNPTGSQTIQIPLDTFKAPSGTKISIDPPELTEKQEADWIALKKNPNTKISFNVEKAKLPIQVLLDKVIMLDKAIGQNIILLIDFTSIEFGTRKTAQKARENSYGVYLRFIFPPNIEFVTPIASLISKPNTSGPIQLTFPYLQQNFQLPFSPLSKDNVDLLLKQTLTIEVHGHAASHSAEVKSKDDREIAQLREVLAQRKQETIKTIVAMKAQDDDIQKTLQEIDYYTGEINKLESGGKSSSCTVL